MYIFPSLYLFIYNNKNDILAFATIQTITAVMVLLMKPKKIDSLPLLNFYRIHLENIDYNAQEICGKILG